jgi:hypothetical protein
MSVRLNGPATLRCRTREIPEGRFSCAEDVCRRASAAWDAVGGDGSRSEVLRCRGWVVVQGVTKLRVTELSMPTRLSRHRESSLSVSSVSPDQTRSEE